MNFETACVHGTYRAKKGEPQVVPMVQSTTYRYYDTDDVASMFDLTSATHMYSRISNPTIAALEEKMALLEGGVAAVAASSGQGATMLCALAICEAGDHILCNTNVYGGTNNLIGVSFKKLGISHTFVAQEATYEEIIAAATPSTKMIFAETLANPALTILDFEKWSKAAKTLGVPLVVDNTLATPYLCKPIEHGANVVIHSTTKYSDGHGTSMGGMVIDGGNFDWKQDGKFPGLTQPDESYHGLIYTESFGSAALAVKIRAQMLRDYGCTMAPMNAWITSMGLQTLHLRMERHCENAQGLAEFLAQDANIEWVNYPGLVGSKEHDLQKKYMPKGGGGVITFGVKGGFKAGRKLIEALELSSLVVHVGDIHTCVLHPASATHRQLSEADQIKAGVKPEMIRVSVGLENKEDIIADFKAAIDVATS